MSARKRDAHVRAALALAATAMLSVDAPAQLQARRWDVGTHIGITSFDKGTGIDGSPFVGVDATYRGLLQKTLAGLDLGFGINFAASQPQTIGDQFPVVQLDFGDTTFLHTVAQRITLLQFGAHGAVSTGFGALRVYALGGTGGYSITVNPRQNARNETFVHQLWQGGLGATYALSETIGIRLEGRSVWFTGFDRDRLDPTVGYTRDRRVRDALPPPHPEPKDGLAQNWQLSLVFNYVPNRVSGTPSEPEADR